MLEKGYSNTGIQEVLSSLGVPKGSFYHYFESKENFALAVIQHLDHDYTIHILSMLRNAELTPLLRLKSYCEDSRNGFLSQQCRKGCLIGNLTQEMSDQSEVLRKELSTVLSKRLDLFAACFEEGQAIGEITKICSPNKLAQIFNCGWSGAVMHCKAVKTPEAMDTFIELMFEHLLKA